MTIFYLLCKLKRFLTASSCSKWRKIESNMVLTNMVWGTWSWTNMVLDKHGLGQTWSWQTFFYMFLTNVILTWSWQTQYWQSWPCQRIKHGLDNHGLDKHGLDIFWHGLDKHLWHGLDKPFSLHGLDKLFLLHGLDNNGLDKHDIDKYFLTGLDKHGHKGKWSQFWIDY